MSLGEGDVVYQRRTFDNLVKALDFDRTLPDRVHVGPWSDFLFFPSDHVFAPDFPEVVRELLSVERAHVACLLNLGACTRFAVVRTKSVPDRLRRRGSPETQAEQRLPGGAICTT